MKLPVEFKDAQPGDTWGPYQLEADGWFVLMACEEFDAFRPSTDKALAGGSVVVDAATGDRDESKGEIMSSLQVRSKS